MVVERWVPDSGCLESHKLQERCTMIEQNLKKKTAQVWAVCKEFWVKWWRWILASIALVLIVLIFLGYWVSWTGFRGHYDAKGEWQTEKTLLALGAWLLNRAARSREYMADERRVKEQQRIELDRSRETALQTYLDRMTDLIGVGLRESEPASACGPLPGT